MSTIRELALEVIYEALSGMSRADHEEDDLNARAVVDALDASGYLRDDR